MLKEQLQHEHFSFGQCIIPQYCVLGEDFIFEATILTQYTEGETVSIPRMPFSIIPSDFLSEFKRFSFLSSQVSLLAVKLKVGHHNKLTLSKRRVLFTCVACWKVVSARDCHLLAAAERKKERKKRSLQGSSAYNFHHKNIQHIHPWE
jgi:hypothetical protein